MPCLRLTCIGDERSLRHRYTADTSKRTRTLTGRCAVSPILGQVTHYRFAHVELRDTRLQLAGGVGQWLTVELEAESFATGSAKFNGEWLFGSYMMAAMGFGQCALVEDEPQQRADLIESMALCIDQILSEQCRQFDAAAWGENPIETLETGRGHLGYLGYLSLPLSLLRVLEPDNRHAALNDRVAAALARRLASSDSMLIETYPGEGYPVDNAAAVAGLALHGLATDADHSELVGRWVNRCRASYIDPQTGAIRDQPRGSGSLLAAYFLLYADRSLAGELYAAVKQQLAGDMLGFGMMREYPHGIDGRGDIDSGPIILGYGISSTGFALASARAHQDRDHFAQLYSTVYLFGGPLDMKHGRQFVAGGPLGDAIMFAMLTAPLNPVAPPGEGQ